MAPQKKYPNHASFRRTAPSFGLVLARPEMEALRLASIAAKPDVELRYQEQAERWVLLGEESGGGIGAIGHYVGFLPVGHDGVLKFHQQQTLAANCIHRLVVGQKLLRFEVFRSGSLCHFQLGLHWIADVHSKHKIQHFRHDLFRGYRGTLDFETKLPTFLTRSAEPITLDDLWRPGLHAAVLGTFCNACRHSHFSDLEAVPEEKFPFLQERQQDANTLKSAQNKKHSPVLPALPVPAVKEAKKQQQTSKSKKNGKAQQVNDPAPEGRSL